MKRDEFKAMVKTIRTTGNREEIQSAGGFNAWLMAGYKRQTGQTIFRTYKQWRGLGFNVRKGESSFAIFSRPIGVIKAEQGKTANMDESKYFGVCHLFHAGQVDKIAA